MLIILIATIAFIAGALPSYLIAKKNTTKKLEAAAETNFTEFYMDGFRKGYESGNTEGRRAANLDDPCSTELKSLWPSRAMLFLSQGLHAL